MAKLPERIGDSPTPSSAEARARELVDNCLCAESKQGCEEVAPLHYNDLVEAIAAALSTPQPTLQQAIDCVRQVVKGWSADVDESWDERPDLSFEAADKIAGANEIITALESLASTQGNDDEGNDRLWCGSCNRYIDDESPCACPKE